MDSSSSKEPKQGFSQFPATVQCLQGKIYDSSCGKLKDSNLSDSVSSTQG